MFNAMINLATPVILCLLVVSLSALTGPALALIGTAAALTAFFNWLASDDKPAKVSPVRLAPFTVIQGGAAPAPKSPAPQAARRIA